MTEEKAKKYLESIGYQTYNLWHIQDVQSIFNCTNEEAMKVLIKALIDSSILLRGTLLLGPIFKEVPIILAALVTIPKDLPSVPCINLSITPYSAHFPLVPTGKAV